MIKFFLKLLEKKYLLFFCYIFFLFITIFIFSYLMSVEHHDTVDDFGNLRIFDVNNAFGRYIESIMVFNIPKVLLWVWIFIFQCAQSYLIF